MNNYEKTNWIDHLVEFPDRYTITYNADGTVKLEPKEGEIYSDGTPINAINLNKLEDGIAKAQNIIEVVKINGMPLVPDENKNVNLEVAELGVDGKVKASQMPNLDFALKTDVGDKTLLNTSSKINVVSAVNEVNSAVKSLATNTIIDFGMLTAEHVNNMRYPKSYVGDISNGALVGLSAGYHHIVYYRYNYYGLGYGYQIAYPFENTFRIYSRTAGEGIWHPWKLMYDESSILKGTAPLEAGVTPLANGVLYCQYE